VSSSRRRAWFVAATILLTLPMALVASEVTARVLKHFFCSGRGDRLHMPHSTLGWFHPSGASGWSHACRGREFEFRTYVRMNSLGLRDRELDYRRSGDRPRVLLLGDSITEAVQVDFEETFAERLETAWRVAGRDVEVVNGGVSAYSTDNELLFYREEGRRYAADLVVLVFNFQNDVAENHPEIFGRMMGAGRRDERLVKPTAVFSGRDAFAFDTSELEAHVDKLDRDPQGRPRAWSERLAATFHVVRVIRRWIDRCIDGPESPSPIPLTFDIYDTPPSSLWVEAWERTEAFVLALRRDVEADGAGFVVALMPDKAMIEPRWWSWFATRAGDRASRWRVDYPRGRMLAWLAEVEIDTIDLTEALRDYRRERAVQPFFEFDIHLTPAGHEAVAATLLHELTPRLQADGGTVIHNDAVQ
jgi:hypothetical protein